MEAKASSVSPASERVDGRPGHAEERQAHLETARLKGERSCGRWPEESEKARTGGQDGRAWVVVRRMGKDL